MKNKQKENSKTALITGASSGIGKEIAKIFFDKKYNLVLVGRTLNKLKQLKIELEEINPELKIDYFKIDLSKKDSYKELFDFVIKNDIHIDVLVNNAGSGDYGNVFDMDGSRVFNMLTLNNYTLTMLCSYFSKEMKKKKEGYILNIASLAAYQPVPFIAAYAASKSYILNFSEAIAMELEDYGIVVTCFSPGHTNTNFFKNAQIDDGHKFYGVNTRVSPELVAKSAVDALFKKKLSVIGGFKNTVLGTLNKLSSRKMTARISKRLVSK